jgi:PAS domain S-box-containing protein
MSDWDKTKAELIAELEQLRSEVARLSQETAATPAVLPAQPADSPTPSVPTPPIILVIEDDVDLNHLICKVLDRHYQIVTAHDGKAGWQKALESHPDLIPDLILCDLQLPEVNGDQLICWMRSHSTLRETPILLLSASPADYLKVQLLQLGAQDYLTKPFSTQELELRVSKLLATNRERVELEHLIEKRTVHLRQANHQLQQEIANRQQAAQVLRESERKFRAIFDQTFEFVGLITLDGKVLEANQAVLDAVGTQRSAVVGKFLWDTPWWSHAAAAQAELKQAIAQAASGQFVRYEVSFPGANGSIITADFSLKPVFDEQGQIVMLIPEGRDITDRKKFEQELEHAKAELEIRVAERTAALTQANSRLLRELIERQQVEAALRQSEALFRSLSESAPIGIFMLDAQGRGTYHNLRAQEICGCNAEEALGNGWMRLIHPDDLDQILAQWKAIVAANGDGVFNEMRYLHPDGTIRYGKVQTAPIFGANGELTGYVGTIEDMTENRTIERMKSEFISVVSHELRTPLTSIRGSLGLLATGIYNHRPDKAHRMIEIALTDTDRLVRLVNDILDLERLDSGEVPLVREVCDVTTLMRRSVEAIQAIAKLANVTLTFTPNPAQAWVNLDAIIQTLTNLISNAIKFSPPYTTIRVSVQQVEPEEPGRTNKTAPGRKRLTEPDQTACPTSRQFPYTSTLNPPYLLFAVEDQGRGIPPEKLNTIFQRFQQVDASDSRLKGGTGLGLAICRSIVQQHGGRIWAESCLGEGSTFYFTVPLPPPHLLAAPGRLPTALQPEASHVN